MIRRISLALVLSLFAIVGALAQGVTVQGLPEATAPLRATGGTAQDVFWCGQGSVTRKCYLTDILSALPNITAKINVPGNSFYGGPSVGAGIPTFRALSGTDIPTPTSTTLGGVFSNAGTAHRYIAAILTSGAVTVSQPSVDDLAEGSTGSSTVVRSFAPTITGGATINGGLTLGTRLSVANGGTGLGSGTSGGVPAFTASGTMTSSGALTLNAPMLGGGAGAVPVVAPGINSNGASALALGVSSTTTGQIQLRGRISGGVTLSAQEASGTGNIKMPLIVSGVLAAAATSPLSLASDGTISCPTCGTLSVTPVTNSLSGDVALNNTGTYSDGPSVSAGSSGTVFATGTVSLVDTAGTAAFYCKLWDGATIIATAATTNNGATNPIALSLSGYLASPAGNIRISCRDISATTGKILFNQTGNSKDSTISAYRIN